MKSLICLAAMATLCLLVVAHPAVPQDNHTAVVEGRGKGMKHVAPLLAAGAMKVGMVGVLAFKALALLVGKALLVAKLAFLLAAVIGLKKLLSQSKHVTYEVVAHPHHAASHHVEPHQDSYSSGWGRAATAVHVSPPQPSADPHSLAYKAHAQ